MTLTDRDPEMLALLRRNVAANESEATVRRLDFADPATYVTEGDPVFDLVVAAEVLYEGCGAHLANTLAAVIRHPAAEALLAYHHRDEAPLDEFLAACYTIGFSVERLEDAEGLVVAGSKGDAEKMYSSAVWTVLATAEQAAAMIRDADAGDQFSSGNCKVKANGGLQLLRFRRTQV